jgi:hypothetical protein
VDPAERGALVVALPTTDEYAFTGGKRNDFQKGLDHLGSGENTTAVTQRPEG